MLSEQACPVLHPAHAPTRPQVAEARELQKQAADAAGRVHAEQLRKVSALVEQVCLR